MNPRIRRRLQVLLDRLEQVERDAGEIRSGDPLAARFASFGRNSRISAPRVALMNPASVAIGDDVYIRSFSCIEALAPPGTAVLQIGNRVQIGHHCRFVAMNGIVVEDDAGIGHHVSIGDSVHDWKQPSVAPGWQTPLVVGRPLRIGAGATLGNNNVLVGGITIGARSITAPNCFLNRDVPPDTVVAGNPARVVRRRLPSGEWEWAVDPASMDIETRAAIEGPPA